VSKFFQALENAEKERAAAETTDRVAPETAPAVASSAPPVAAPPAVAPAPPVVTPTVVTEPKHTMPSKPSPAPSPVSTKPPTPVATKPAAPQTTRSTATIDAPPQRRATFGSPIARSKKNGRTHAEIFASEIPGGAPREAGQLDDHLVSLLEPTGFAAEQYRTVRLAIENFRRERGLHVVAISSPGRGEGKTISAINLAGALAQSPDARVVLVDTDLRHPRIAEYLGIASARGLSSYLLDMNLEPDMVIEKPSSIAFSVVPAGPVSSMPYELLKSPRLAALIATLRTRFDFVVLDTPPVLAFPDVGILRDVVDGFVMIVRANRTPREGLIDGLDTIGRHRVLGLVFNDDDRNGAAISESESDSRWRKYLSLNVGG
jgi:protein-tyrosine kinase